jgi:hypothetical protein
VSLNNWLKSEFLQKIPFSLNANSQLLVHDMALKTSLISNYAEISAATTENLTGEA